MALKKFQAALVSLTVVLSTLAFAQDQEMSQGRGTLSYLQKEPTTLFDMGMKRLRKAALDTVSRMVTKPGTQPTSSVSYKHDEGIINILFNLQTESADNMETLRLQCLDKRRSTILRMFRVGLTDYTSQLSTGERLRRRIGIQFTHEPIGSVKEALSVGEQLGQITYFTVSLTTTTEPAVSVSCRALATDLLVK
ncbi:MAG: hypothetical protein HQ504_06415 [Rhodospirillaceae bacterium]|nr:hypothetical protein [Rhodospirillaceae bacterium]